jgi:hypothetical protein
MKAWRIGAAILHKTVNPSMSGRANKALCTMLGTMLKYREGSSSALSPRPVKYLPSGYTQQRGPDIDLELEALA